MILFNSIFELLSMKHISAMDKINREANDNFKQLFAFISKTYSELSKSTNQSYAIGKKEAFEEVLYWLNTSHNSELKYVSAGAFHNMMGDKITKAKIALNSKQEEDDEIKAMTEMKIQDNKKKAHRQNVCEQKDDNNNNHNNNSSSFNFPISVQNLIQQNMNSGSYYNNSNGYSSDDSMNSGSLYKRKK